MTPKRKIELLADSLINYIIDNEHAGFIDFFIDEGWDEHAVCKALGVNELSEELANNIATSSLHEGTHNLADCVAYHTGGQHVYADAIKLAVLIKAAEVPKLTKSDIKQILEDADEPQFAVGSRVYWTDPDEGLCSGYGVVAKYLGSDTYSINRDDHGEVEAPGYELTLKKPKKGK